MYLTIAEVAMEWIVEPGGVEIDTSRREQHSEPG
jgi:hypothetical protein